MASPYGAPAVDFYGMLSGIGDTFAGNRKVAREQAILDARKKAFDEVDPNSTDFSSLANAAAIRLGRAGDTEGASTFLRIGQQASESKRTQQNADRTFNEGVRQFNITSQGRPTTEKVKNADGSESLMRVMPDGSTRPIAATGAGGTPANPFAPPGKQTEGQANASLYAGRMFQAEKILRDPKMVGAATSARERAIEGAPSSIFGLNVGLGAAKNWAHSAEFQKFDQAQRDFINAVLRRESGAVISDSEFENARKQYFPQLGDTPDVIRQKQMNRQEAIRGIAGAAGPNWRPPFTFDQGGEMVEGKAPPAADPLARAREAIARGADRNAVIQRLRENGIDPSGL